MAKRRRGQPASATARVIGRTRPIAVAGKPERRLGPVVIIALVAVAAVIVLGIGLFGAAASPYACAAELQPQAGATVEDPTVTPDLGNEHVPVGTKVDYASCPPASGPHYAESGIAPVAPGFFDPGARVGPGNWIHNLEHGFVVALYRCIDGTCPSDDELNALRRFILNGPSTPTATACGYQSKVIAARFDDMATPFALLAWQRVLLLDTFDDAAALDFASRWIETTAREPNAC